MMRSLIRWIMRGSLRRSFRRVCWIGEWPSLPGNRPVVLYANHHYYHDGYLLWLLINELQRDSMIWMRELSQFPLFRKMGALPFPADDFSRRVATVRETVRRMRASPRLTLAYFPEGHLHPPEEELLPFPKQAMQRLHRLLPDSVVWWPVAFHVTWWGEPRPTALMTGGSVQEAPTGDERSRLAALREQLCTTDPHPQRLLLEGYRWFL